MSGARSPFHNRRTWAAARGHGARVEVKELQGGDAAARLAAAPHAVVLDDDGLGELLGRELTADVALVVQDALHRADHAAGAAVDAQLGVDDVDDLALTGDGVGGAALGAGGAAEAGLDGLVGHGVSLIVYVMGGLWVMGQ